MSGRKKRKSAYIPIIDLIAEFKKSSATQEAINEEMGRKVDELGVSEFQKSIIKTLLEGTQNQELEEILEMSLREAQDLLVKVANSDSDFDEIEKAKRTKMEEIHNLDDEILKMEARKRELEKEIAVMDGKLERIQEQGKNFREHVAELDRFADQIIEERYVIVDSSLTLNNMSSHLMDIFITTREEAAVAPILNNFCIISDVQLGDTQIVQEVYKRLPGEKAEFFNRGAKMLGLIYELYAKRERFVVVISSETKKFIRPGLQRLGVPLELIDN